MKIGFDGKRAANNLTGLGNYSRSLIAHMAQLFPQNQYFVYTPKIKSKPQITAFLNHPGVFARRPDQPSLLWRTLGIKKQLTKDQIDLFHGLSHEIPTGLRIPALVTVHDLIFLRFPQYFGVIDRFIYKLKCSYACMHANKIIAISECTKRDIITFFHIDPEKIEVVYQSCDDSFKRSASDKKKSEVRRKFELPERYLLNVGTIEERKNLLTLVRALKHIDPAYKLVVVGRPTVYTSLVHKEIELQDLRSRIIFLKDVPFDELPAIYQMASVFVYPSVYEGFGIPVIEALYSGVPVVAASGSCLEEAGGPDSSYVSPFDHMGFAGAVNNLIHSPTDTLAKLSAKGSAYVQRFNNEPLSAKMMEIYRSVLSAYSTH
ncbi:MAG TPA: glycosyltransferase family 1 protein [Pedobacter sp.]|nr:glycosyltransferase family 1 protein [Pedobacter sp.]